MRIESVVARAFGALRNEKLELASGLTVVTGPNETGKSTWQGAIRAGLTGVRRGRGRPHHDEQQFEELHRPWDRPDEWAVETRLVLDDGRHIDLVQDIADKVASRATDISLGRDVSDEIIHDGSPDASRWLGLDRDAFARTVWVGQGEILVVAARETADLIQDYLQRAASSQGADATAAEALQRLDEFRKNGIGTEHAATRPLRSTREALANGRTKLDHARAEHARYLTLLARADLTRRMYGQAALNCRGMRAALATRDADQLQANAARAAELAKRYPTEPKGATERDELSDRVATALHAWSNQPMATPQSGNSASDLRRELDALPAAPGGDLETAVEVASAHEFLMRAQGALDSLGDAPATTPPPEAGGLTESDLRSIATDLGSNVPEVSASARQRFDESRERVRRSQRQRAFTSFAFILVALLAGGGLAQGSLPTTILAVVVAVALGLWLMNELKHLSVAESQMASAQVAITVAEQSRAEATARRAEAARRAESAGLRPDPARLRSLADEVRAYLLNVRDMESWTTHHGTLVVDVTHAQQELREALRMRGETDTGLTVGEAHQAYMQACRSRREQANLASSREALEKALKAREDADRTAAAAASQVAEAEQTLRSVAAEACNRSSGTCDELVEVLVAWQTTRAALVTASDRAMRDWQELQALLHGQSVAVLAQRADEASRRASDLMLGLATNDVPATATASELRLAELEADEHGCLVDRENAEAQRAASAKSIVAVAEVEEEVAFLEEELQRLESLAAVVDATIELLHSAEERVHRDLAPVLAAVVQAYLPKITGGRYTEVTVDPEDLTVKAKEAWSGQWRSALMLSGGTREQIYLLLRVAMAAHLGSRTETAPLFLDEVTAQSDGERARSLMEALHMLSRDRQIVVFTHDEAVALWAATNLTGPCDKLVRLSPPAAVQDQPARAGVAEAPEAPAVVAPKWWADPALRAEPRGARVGEGD